MSEQPRPYEPLTSENAAFAQREKRKARQKAENEIAEVIGWRCTMEIPRDEFEDLCKRWPNVDADELFSLKQRYEPRAAAVGIAMASLSVQPRRVGIPVPTTAAGWALIAASCRHSV